MQDTKRLRSTVRSRSTEKSEERCRAARVHEIGDDETKRNEEKANSNLLVNYLLIKLKDILMNIIYKKNFSWYVTRAWIMFIIVVAHPFAWPTLLYKTSVSRMRESIQPLLFLFRLLFRLLKIYYIDSCFE